MKEQALEVVRDIIGEERTQIDREFYKFLVSGLVDISYDIRDYHALYTNLAKELKDKDYSAYNIFQIRMLKTHEPLSTCMDVLQGINNKTQEILRIEKLLNNGGL